MYAPCLGGDKLVKAQMSRKTTTTVFPPVDLAFLFHTCHSRWHRWPIATTGLLTNSDKFKLSLSITARWSTLRQGPLQRHQLNPVTFFIWSKINRKHSCSQINPEYLSPAFELLDWIDACRVEKHCRLRTAFSSSYFFNCLYIYV